MRGHAVVIDVGKTQSKASLWTPDGVLVARRTRNNARVQGPGYLALDAAGIESWLTGTLAEFAQMAMVTAIVPVGHGAAVALVRDGGLLLPPMDYETPIPPRERLLYDAQRDDFRHTGSPALPDGLNLGAQLHWIESLHPGVLGAGVLLLPWAQYWAWRLCGVAASEVTSLGCHTDLWNPVAGAPSTLATRRGWAGLMAPLRHASDCLGSLTTDWVQRTGLKANVEVHCGLHDSNAALLAARGFREVAAGEATVLSTGTWFVGMRSTGSPVELAALPEHRDCLVNCDIQGRPVPSARFMGGREIELLTGLDSRRIDTALDQPALLAAVPQAQAQVGQLLPTFAAGCGPFPHSRGQWLNPPADETVRRAAIGLYAALVTDISLDLIGTCDHLIVEGRFAAAQVFVRALATLRPDMSILVVNDHSDASFGALRLLDPALEPAGGLSRVEPLAKNLDGERRQWRAAAERRIQSGQSDLNYGDQS